MQTFLSKEEHGDIKRGVFVMRNLFVLLALALLVVGCASEPKKIAEPASMEDSIDTLDNSLDEIDQLDSELNLSDLDNLEQDLENIS